MTAAADNLPNNERLKGQNLAAGLSPQGSRRFLAQTPSFASSSNYIEDGQDGDMINGMADFKQRLADMERVSAQQTDMITLTIKDLYRFCQESSERQVSHTELIVNEAI